MSRQKGSRGRPRAEQERYRRQFSSEARRRTPRERPALELGDPIPWRRRWGAAVWSTLVLVVAFGAVVTAIVQEDDGNHGAATAAISVAAVLVPIAFALLAYLSRRRRPMTAVALGAPVAIAGFLGVGTLLRDPTTALVFAFGVVGTFVMGGEPVHRLSLRVSIVSIASLLVLVLGFVAPAVAVVVAPFLPFPALVVADRISESRAA